MNLIEWAIHIAQTLGGPGVALLLFLENVFPPIPSEVILPVAGVTAGLGHHSFLAMLLWALVGGLAGAYLLYGIGYAFGAKRVRALCARLPLLEVEDFDKSLAWFARRGEVGIFFGRMVPGIRSLISIPAGVYRMPLTKFTVLTVAGSTIWNTLFITLGYFLGENWTAIAPYTDLFSNVVYVVVAVLVVWFVVARVLRNRRRARG
ncbi:MAG: DedA family protein [Propionibacterium sp.]|nr:DedA family protein [Propionibacterium sp.]